MSRIDDIRARANENVNVMSVKRMLSAMYSDDVRYLQDRYDNLKKRADALADDFEGWASAYPRVDTRSLVRYRKAADVAD